MSPRRRGRGRLAVGPAVAAAPAAAGAPLERAETEAIGAPPEAGPDGASANVTGEGAIGATSGARRGGGEVRSNGPAFRRESRANVTTAGVVDDAARQKASCTLAQMRRFIKSRPYVPVHELRRRFMIEGVEDEVSPMATGQGTLYVGLPEREAGFLGELVKAGEVGCELLLDPSSPGVVGVFPMRPIARQ
ncbi:MAG: hypothetical protein ABSG37_02130 [Candidatus Limnocylindrales bacterium]